MLLAGILSRATVYAASPIAFPVRLAKATGIRFSMQEPFPSVQTMFYHHPGRLFMHSVTPRTPPGKYSTHSSPPALHAAARDTNPGNLSPLRQAEVPASSYPRNAYQSYNDFCESGTLPDGEPMQSSIAGYCLKYGEPQVLAAFLDSGNVKSLDLSGSFLDMRCAQALASVLKTNTTLLRIRVADNDFGAEGLEAICSALEENSTLIALDLSRNDATGPKCVEAIGRMMVKNRTIEVLELECAGIAGERLQILTEALRQNQTLTELGLKFNFMGAEGVRLFLQAAEKIPALEILDLSGNKIGPEGGKLIAGILKTNSTLKQIDLSCNELGPEGANAILNAVQGNPTLRSLSLAYNGMDAGNAKPIASLLQNNTALSSLDFSCNRKLLSDEAPADEAIDCIVRGLECNTTLTELHLMKSHSNGQLPVSRPHSVWGWHQPQYENDLGRIDNLLQRNRLLNALPEKDARLASQLFPGRLLSLDEGRLLAGAMVIASPSTAAYEATMVEIQCCVNVLASQT
jgi:Ran GTPase-activating protein (RanGAP) involved in mRNA processing and transport